MSKHSYEQNQATADWQDAIALLIAPFDCNRCHADAYGFGAMGLCWRCLTDLYPTETQVMVPSHQVDAPELSPTTR